MVEAVGGAMLIVDDEKALARSIARQLAVRWPVAIAHDAAETKAVVAGRHFRLALVDYHLPGQPGIDLAIALRSQGVADVIVIFTGDDSDEVADRILSNGFVLMLKPFGSEQLRALSVLVERADDRGESETRSRFASAADARGHLVGWLVRQGVDRQAANGAAHILSHRSRSEAAIALGRSPHSIRDYIRPCLDYTGARNRTELLQGFIGLVDLTRAQDDRDA